jgi:hypothetical protein
MLKPMAAFLAGILFVGNSIAERASVTPESASKTPVDQLNMKCEKSPARGNSALGCCRSFAFKVKLKAEVQGNNRDLYRPEAIVASSAK